MKAQLLPYAFSLYALLGVAILFFVQLLVADVARIRAKITPGVQLPQDPTLFVFRAERAHKNTMESFGLFVIATLMAFLVEAPATWVNAICTAFLAARFGHMAMYYANQSLPRSVFWGFGTLSLAIQLILVGVSVP